MSMHSPVVYVISFLALLVAAHPMPTRAEPPANPEAGAGAQKENEVTKLVERFLRSAPASALRKLKEEATAAKGASELTKYIGRSAINKRVVVHIKVAAAEATSEARNSFRVGPETAPVTWDGGRMNLLSWFYFPESNATELKDAPVGSEITVAGVVRRCEIVVVEGDLQFNFDLWKATIEKHK